MLFIDRRPPPTRGSEGSRLCLPGPAQVVEQSNDCVNRRAIYEASGISAQAAQAARRTRASICRLHFVAERVPKCRFAPSKLLARSAHSKNFHPSVNCFVFCPHHRRQPLWTGCCCYPLFSDQSIDHLGQTLCFTIIISSIPCPSWSNGSSLKV